MHFKILLSIIFLLLGFTAVLACSTVTMPPYRFDRSQYIFTGEVIGYIVSNEPLKVIKGGGEPAISVTSGIIVRVKDLFFTPEPVKKTYEVYRFGLGAGCELYDIGIEYFKERYRLGETVQVFAGYATHLESSKTPETGRLEIRYSGEDVIYTINKDDRTVRDSILSAGFDYQQYRQDLKGDVWFEVIKDMLRLENAKNEEERAPILDRLTYYPRDGFFLRELFMQYTYFPYEFDKWAEIAQKRSMTPQAYKLLYEKSVEQSRKRP